MSGRKTRHLKIITDDDFILIANTESGKCYASGGGDSAYTADLRAGVERGEGIDLCSSTRRMLKDSKYYTIRVMG